MAEQTKAETKTKPSIETKLSPPAPNNGRVALRPLDSFMAAVLPEREKGEIINVLPKHVPFDRFERNLANALMQNPQLMECPPRMVFREVSKLAALGLLLDPQLGEAYLVVGWNYKEGRKEPQSRIGYRGFIKLSRQSGDVLQVYAHEVCENDECIVELGTAKTLVHKPAPFGKPRGPVVGYYAVAKLANGETDFETMDIEQVHAIRDRSDAWQAYRAGKIKSTPWGTDEDEMAKKTVLRRFMKRLPMSPDLADAMREEDRAEGYEPLPPPPPRDGSGKTATGALDGFAGRQAAKVTDITPETGQQGGDSGPQEGSGQPAGTDAPAKAEATQGVESGAGAAEPGPNPGKAGQEIAQPGPQEAEPGPDPGGVGQGTADSGPQESTGQPGATVAPAATEATGGAENGDGGPPKMPADIEAAWTVGGDPMPAYKWLVASIPVAEPQHRQALADEHRMILEAMRAKSPGYADRIKRLLIDHGVKLEQG